MFTSPSTRIAVIVLGATLVVSSACQPSRKDPGPDLAPSPPPPPKLTTRGHAASLPETTPPSAVKPTPMKTTPYVPRADPENTGGFLFSAKHSPTAPADRRRQPFSISSLYEVRNVGAPHFSPDGKHILFTLTRYDLEAGKANVDIYAVDAAGTHAPRRLTHNPGADYRPRWAPDGRSFLFLSSRKEGMQVWRMPIDGGEAEQLTTLATGVDQAEWAPDGEHIAISTRVFPEYGADADANKAALKAQRKNPIKAHLADDLLFRHWTSWRDGRRWHVLYFSLKDKHWKDLTPGDFDSPAFEADPGFTFSPDGKELCFVSNRQRDASARAYTTNKDLWVVPTRGGSGINLTGANTAFDGQPAYSPDGKTIAFLRQETPGHESDRFRLALYDRKTGKIRILTEHFDNWVLDFTWAEDSQSIVFRGAEKGRFPLYRVSVDAGKITRLAPPSCRDFDVGPKGKIALTFSRVDAPRELFITDGQGQRAQRLTSFNGPLCKRVDFRPVEERWIPGADGKKVHTFIVKPHGFRQGHRYPLIINVHGGPQYQWADNFRGDWQVYPGAGYVVAYPNPHGSIGYGQAYTSAISKDYGGKVFEDIAKVTDALAKESYVDPKRIGAMGWSWGGYAMAWLAGHSTRYKALAAMMPVYDTRSFYGATEELWFPEWDLGGPPWKASKAYEIASPSAFASHFKTPTLVLTGQRDFRVPYTQGLQFFTALRRQKVPARLVVFQNDGHWPSVAKSMPLYYAAHLDWFERYLGGKGSPWKVEDLVRGTAFKKDVKKK